MPIRVGCKKLLDRKSKTHAQKKRIVRSIKKRKKKRKKEGISQTFLFVKSRTYSGLFIVKAFNKHVFLTVKNFVLARFRIIQLLKEITIL